MIKPQKSKIYSHILNIFLEWKFKKSFNYVNFYLNKKINPCKSLIIIGNHSTWWDGFLMWQLNRQILGKQFYLLMLETQLKKLWFFQKIGCFSINPGSKSVVESLKIGSDILRNKDNMLVFYPQGRLYSLYDESFRFNKGLDYILRNNTEVELLFYSLFVDYGSNEKPYLNVFMEIVPNPQDFNFTDLEEKYKAFYSGSKIKHSSDFKP